MDKWARRRTDAPAVCRRFAVWTMPVGDEAIAFLHIGGQASGLRIGNWQLYWLSYVDPACFSRGGFGASPSNTGCHRWAPDSCGKPEGLPRHRDNGLIRRHRRFPANGRLAYAPLPESAWPSQPMNVHHMEPHPALPIKENGLSLTFTAANSNLFQGNLQSPRNNISARYWRVYRNSGCVSSNETCGRTAQMTLERRI